MLDPQVLLHLGEALEGRPDWLEVRTRLQRLAPEGREQAYRPFVFAFGYLLVERSQADRRERAGGPFGAAHRADDWRFPPAVADVEEADVQAWVDAGEALEDPVSSARLHDLLWERRARPRPDLDARAAADAYLALVELDGWHVMERTRCLTRAIELAHAVNDVDRLERAVERCVRFVGEVVASSDRGPGAAMVILHALVDLPPKHRPAELQGLLAAVTERFGDDPHLFNSLAELGARAADHEGRGELRRAQVQRWREAAEQGDAFLRVIRLEQALEVARTHGLAEEADEIRRELQDITPEDLPLEAISARLELPAEEVKAYIASIAEQEDWREALRHFGSEDPPGGTSQAMEDDLDREREEFALLHVFTKTVMGHATAASLFRAGDEESRRRLDRAERRAMYARMWSPLAADILRAVLQRHGRPGHDELADFFATELIGAERGERIARALELFWDGQPDESAHLLVPRVESVVREMARRVGLTVIREPVGDEPGGARSLGTLLLELRGAFPDPDWHDYLFNLLANPLGLNLRNTVAHGLSPRVSTGDAALLLHAACYLRLLGATPVEATENITNHAG